MERIKKVPRIYIHKVCGSFMEGAILWPYSNRRDYICPRCGVISNEEEITEKRKEEEKNV